MAGGRPLKFKSVEELAEKIIEYFIMCDPHIAERDAIRTVTFKDGTSQQEVYRETYITDQVPYTVTGLALALKTSRETLLNYEERDEFFDTIKEAKIKCQNFTELALYKGNATGPIFSLKNNYDWKDKTETELYGKGGKDLIPDKQSQEKADSALESFLGKPTE